MKQFWLLSLVAFILIAFTANTFAAPIYVFKQKDGTIRFTNRKPPESTNVIEFKAHQSGFSYYRVKGFPHRGHHMPRRLEIEKYKDIITEIASRHGVDESLIRAVIHIESAFNPYAVSPKGARGLMQLMPETARELGVRNVFEAKQNIDGGAKYLSWLIKRFNGNISMALAGYNAGPGAVDDYRGVPPYSETKSYIQNVLALNARYKTAKG